MVYILFLAFFFSLMWEKVKNLLLKNVNLGRVNKKRESEGRQTDKERENTFGISKFVNIF